MNVVGAGPRPARRSRILFGIRRRGQAPALQKTDAQKSGRKPFKAGGPVCRPYGVLQVAGQRVQEAQGPSRRGCAGQEVTLIRPFGPPSPLEGEGFRAAAGGALTGQGKCPHNRNRSPHPSGLTASHLSPGEGIAGGASPSPTILKKLFRNWVGEALGPPADHVPAATSSETPGAGAGPQQRKFLQGQGPVARREFETPLRFCAPGLFCLTQGVTLVMGVRG